MSPLLSTLLFSLSFWSSGVVLIRLLTSYHIWQSDLSLAVIFVLTIPVVYFCILVMRRVYTRMHQDATRSLSRLVTFVILAHALALSIDPTLYRAVPSDGVSSTAWLLWFGGISYLMLSRRERPTNETLVH